MRAELTLSHHGHEATRPLTKLSRRDPTTLLAVDNLEHVAKDVVGEVVGNLVRHTLEAVLHEADRVVDVLCKVGIVERRVRPRVPVVQQIEKDEPERPDVCLSRVVRRSEVVAALWRGRIGQLLRSDRRIR